MAQIEAFVSDGKGKCKKILIDEPDEIKIEREKTEILQELALWLKANPNRLKKLQQLVGE